MKALFFATLLAGFSALAAGPQFEIISAKLAPEHGPFGGGKISIDYNANTASLYIDRNTCPPGKYCTLMLHADINAILPIVSVETNECGIKTVIAKKDQRPVDGILQQLTVMDFSQNTCPTFAEIIGTAEYLTSGYRAPNEVEDTQVSTMSTKLLRAESAVLLEKTTTSYFVTPEFQGTTSLQVLVDGTIQQIDNHGQVKVLSQLSATDLLKIQKLIANLGSVKLTKSNGPMCMDAPSHSILAHRAQKNIELWSMSNCQEAKSDNKNAKALVRMMDEIESQNVIGE
jgi:hypothetical protein